MFNIERNISFPSTLWIFTFTRNDKWNKQYLPYNLLMNELWYEVRMWNWMFSQSDSIILDACVRLACTEIVCACEWGCLFGRKWWAEKGVTHDDNRVLWTCTECKHPNYRTRYSALPAELYRISYLMIWGLKGIHFFLSLRKYHGLERTASFAVSYSLVCEISGFEQG